MASVLIVHREETVAKLIEKALQARFNVEVHFTRHLHEAITLMTGEEKDTPSFAFIDLGVVGITDGEMFSFVRSLCYEMSVVAIADTMESAGVKEILSAGACDVLTNPITDHSFNKCINNAIANQYIKSNELNMVAKPTVAMVDADGNLKTLESIEKEVIEYALNGNFSKSKVASMLGIGRTTLYRKAQFQKA